MEKKYTYEANDYTFAEVFDDIDKKKINLNPSFQRNSVWTNEQQEEFLISCFEGINTGCFIFSILDEKKVCIDGKQRLSALYDFYKNKFGIELNKKKYYFSKKPNGKIGNILSEEERKEFLATKVHFVEYNNIEYREQIKIFQRIQDGSPLTTGEKVFSYFNAEDKANIFINIFSNFHVDKLVKKFFCEKDILRYKHYELLLKLLYISSNSILSDIDKKATMFKFCDETISTELISEFLKKCKVLLDSFDGKSKKECEKLNKKLILVAFYTQVKNNKLSIDLLFKFNSKSNIIKKTPMYISECYDKETDIPKKKVKNKKADSDSSDYDSSDYDSSDSE